MTKVWIFALLVITILLVSQHLFSDSSLKPFPLIKNQANYHLETIGHSGSHRVCGPYLSVFEGGRLGNQMSEYASLFAISKLYPSHLPVISPHLHQQLSQIFPNILISSWDAQKCKDISWNIAKPAKSAEGERLLSNANYRMPMYTHLPSLFKEFHHLIINNQFRFSDAIRISANQVLAQIKNDIHPNSKSVNFVGVHIRRADYGLWLIRTIKGRLVSKLFFEKCFEHFLTKYRKVVFVIATDDPDWSKSMFGDRKDAVLTHNYLKGPELIPAVDLAILSQCNHSIITYGTFSFWAAFLRSYEGGETLYPIRYAPTLAPSMAGFSKNDLNWTAIEDPCYTVRNGYVRVTKLCAFKDQQFGTTDPQLEGIRKNYD